MKKVNKYLIPVFIFLVSIVSSYSLKAQSMDAFDTGKKIFQILNSDNPAKIIDMINPSLADADKTAIVQSFISLKELYGRFATNGKKLYFNGIPQRNDKLYIIVRNNRDYFTFKCQAKAGKILGKFIALGENTNKRISAGMQIYTSKCYACHGREGKGSIGPNLTDYYCKFIKKESDMIDLVTNGKKGTMMMAYKNYLSKKQIDDVVFFIKILHGKKVPNSKKSEGDKMQFQFNIF